MQMCLTVKLWKCNNVLLERKEKLNVKQLILVFNWVPTRNLLKEISHSHTFKLNKSYVANIKSVIWVGSNVFAISILSEIFDKAVKHSLSIFILRTLKAWVSLIHRLLTWLSVNISQNFKSLM